MGGRRDSSSSGSSVTDVKSKPRETWQRRFDFLLACIGGSVGLGNVWRFPYLCYKNGGGAFLIPYFLCVILVALPMFFMEVSLGQFMQQGSIGTWKRISPLFKGVGVACTIIISFRNIYYNVILAWIFYYLFSSFTTVLPWSTCDNSWNTPTCRLSAHTNVSGSSRLSAQSNISGDLLNAGPMLSNINGSLVNYTNTNASLLAFTPTDPATEFWQHKVQQISLSSGIDYIGGIKWDLAGCLLLAWVVVYLCIMKGIKTSGKVMYITATSPYFLLLLLLIRGLTLPGALQGVKFYLLPDFYKLADPQVWTDAGTQVFFSSSISVAVLTALGSYNTFHHNCWRDSIIYSAVNSGTSLLAGFVIFPVLGFMAQEQGLSVADVAESGPGLAFIAYPKAISHLPFAPAWSVLFFVTLILLGLDSQFVGVEGFVTAFVDEFSSTLRRGYRKEVFTGISCFVMFLLGLPMVTHGGAYVLQLFDYYLGSRMLLIVALSECFVLAYVYGVDRYYDNVKLMLGFDIGPIMKICWAAITPASIMVLLGLCFWRTKPLTYNRTYEYPVWSEVMGWLIGLSGAAMIPILAAYTLLSTKGSFLQRIKGSIKPRLQKFQTEDGCMELDSETDLCKSHLNSDNDDATNHSSV